MSITNCNKILNMKKILIILIFVTIYGCHSKDNSKLEDSKSIKSSEKITYKEMKLNQEDFLEIKDAIIMATANELNIKSNQVIINNVLESQSNFIWYAMESNISKMVYEYKFMADKNFKKIDKSIFKGGPEKKYNEIEKLTKH